MIQSPRFWMLFPVALLLGSVGLGVGTVMLATGNPSVLAIKKQDYDDQGVGVDERLAAESISRALGWELRWTSRLYSATDADVLTLRVLGPSGEGLDGVTGTIRAFHNGFPNHVIEAELSPSALETGLYDVALDVNRAGYWRLEVDLQRGEDRFVSRWKSRMVEELLP